MKNLYTTYKKEIVFAICTFVMIFLTFIIAFHSQNADQIQVAQRTDTPPVIHGNGTIAYIFTPNIADTATDQLWISDLYGKDATNTNITNISSIYHNPQSDWIFYQKGSDILNIYGYDLKTKATLTLSSKPTTYYMQLFPSGVSLVSPDYLLYQSQDFPPGCDNIEDCLVTTNIVAYNIKTGQSTSLGQFQASGSISKDNLMYAQLNGLANQSIQIQKISISDGKAQTLKTYHYTSTNESDSYFELGDTNMELEIQAIPNQSATITLKKNGNVIVIDKGNDHAFQPNIWLSPDEKTLIYTKLYKESSSQQAFSSIALDLASLKKTILYTPTTLNASLGNGFWLDNDNFLLNDNHELYDLSISTQTYSQIGSLSHVDLFSPLY